MFINQKTTKKKILDNLFESTINKTKNHNKFNNLQININFEDYEKLKTYRSRSLLKNYYLVRQKFIPASINFKNNEYSAKIRLKGDTSQHWYLQNNGV